MLFSDVNLILQVIEVAAISLTSDSEIHSSGSYMGGSSGSIGDTQMGFQLQDLYDHFGVQINEAKVSISILSKCVLSVWAYVQDVIVLQINLMMPSSSTLPLLEKFSASASLVSCILSDEPILKTLKVSCNIASFKTTMICCTISTS